MALPSVDTSVTSPSGTPVIASAYNDKLQQQAPPVNQAAQAAGQSSKVATPTVIGVVKNPPAMTPGSGSTTASNDTPGNTIAGDVPPKIGGTNTVTVGGIVPPVQAPSYTAAIIPAALALGILFFLHYNG